MDTIYTKYSIDNKNINTFLLKKHCELNKETNNVNTKDKKNANLCIDISSKKKTTEYSLKQDIIDPTMNSPPNEFMLKLQLRMSVYNVIKEDNLVIE
jgi:hypothetical protein